MSRKAVLLTTADVPEYIRQIAKRLRPVSPEQYTEECVPGYTFDLYGQHKVGYESQLHAECEKLLKWANSWYADAHIVEERFWYQKVSLGEFEPFGGKTHQRRAYRQHYRNHIRIVITDPVAMRFENDGFYRELTI